MHEYAGVCDQSFICARAYLSIYLCRSEGKCVCVWVCVFMWAHIQGQSAEGSTIWVSVTVSVMYFSLKTWVISLCNVKNQQFTNKIQFNLFYSIRIDKYLLLHDATINISEDSWGKNYFIKKCILMRRVPLARRRKKYA